MHVHVEANIYTNYRSIHAGFCFQILIDWIKYDLIGIYMYCLLLLGAYLFMENSVLAISKKFKLIKIRQELNLIYQ